MRSLPKWNPYHLFCPAGTWDEADHEKAMQAARVLFSIRQTSLIDVFLSNMENSAIVEELIDRYLDEDGNPRPLKVKDGNEPSDDWRKYI